MKIIIIGVGQVGSNLALKLAKEGHDLSIIDKESDRIEEINRMMDVRAIRASISPKILVDYGIENADMLIAVTDVDEINLISCQIAKKYNVPHRIARVNNIDYDSRYSNIDPNDFGADLIINQMSNTTDEIVRIVQIPGATDVAIFSNDSVELVGFFVTSESMIANRHLISLRELEAFRDHLVVAINRNGFTIVPSGQTKILPGDKIYVLGRTDTVNKISPLVGDFKKTVKKIMIFGGNDLGCYLAQTFEKQGFKIILIEPDKARCYELTEFLKTSIIINGVGSDLNLLKMEGIESTDVYIALTENEDANLLACLTAKKNGRIRTVSLVQKPEYLQLSSVIGVDVVISPKISTEGAILKYVRKGKVYTVASIKGTETEVLEIEAETGSPVTQKMIMELNLPKSVILGALVRGDKPIIPDGKTRVEPGDRVILFHLPMNTESLSALFSEGSE